MFARWRILCIELTEDIVVISSGRCISTTVQWLRVFTNTTYIRWRTISAPTICHRLVYQRRRNLFSSDVNKSHELCYLRCFSFDYRHHSHTHTTPPGKRTHEQLKGKTFISFWFGAVCVCVPAPQLLKEHLSTYFTRSKNYGKIVSGKHVFSSSFLPSLR